MYKQVCLHNTFGSRGVHASVLFLGLFLLLTTLLVPLLRVCVSQHNKTILKAFPLKSYVTMSGLNIANACAFKKKSMSNSGMGFIYIILRSCYVIHLPGVGTGFCYPLRE